MDIFTIGHSTHSIEEFTAMLKAHGVQTLVDVRSFPGSRYMPHFNKEVMPSWLKDSAIEYIHMRDLGGRRRKLKDIDENLVRGWKNVSFRNYSAYTLTKEYESAVKELIQLAENTKVCIMCSENVPWRCHRLIISNTLTSQSIEVRHILSEKSAPLHELNKYGAKVTLSDDILIYP